MAPTYTYSQFQQKLTTGMPGRRLHQMPLSDTLEEDDGHLLSPLNSNACYFEWVARGSFL